MHVALTKSARITMRLPQSLMTALIARAAQQRLIREVIERSLQK
jgi:predicted DNA binding CopG/RHH family protein